MKTTGLILTAALLMDLLFSAQTASESPGPVDLGTNAPSGFVTRVGPIIVLEFKADHAPLAARLLVGDKYAMTNEIPFSSQVADRESVVKLAVIKGYSNIVVYVDGPVGGTQLEGPGERVRNALAARDQRYGPRSVHLDNRHWVDLYSYSSTLLPSNVLYSARIQIK